MINTKQKGNGMKFGSVCSGIEAASMAWASLGWQASWFSEIELFPGEVLKHHYPDTPNHGDMTKLPEMVLNGEIEAPDALVGGTPCQSFSVAGARMGLSDGRGQLTIKYVELANAIDTVRRSDGKNECIIVWENVPGILNSKDNAFGCFLAALAGGSSEARAPGGERWANAGYVLGPERAVAWRILDAQYFGLAQRRKRVFVVASAREGFCPAKVLFEFDGVRRDTAPSRETGQETTRDAGEGFTSSSFGQYREGAGTLRAAGGDLGGGSETLVTHSPYQQVSHCLNAGGMVRQDYETESFAITETRQDNLAIAIQGSVIGRKPENGPQGSGYDATGVCFTQTSVDRHAVATNTSVRRLTPIECERLQGFPDGFTKIPWRNKPASECPDGHRYKALGNSMAVPVMRWIGERISAYLP